MVFYFYVTLIFKYFRVYLLINHEEFQEITEIALHGYFFLSQKYVSAAFGNN